MTEEQVEGGGYTGKSWGFTSWQTANIKAWIKRYEDLIAAESFSSKPDIEEMIKHQLSRAKEELTIRLLRGY